MRISDWSSDVCSSDLPGRLAPEILGGEIPVEQLVDHRVHIVGADILAVDVVSMFPHVDHEQRLDARDQHGAERKSVAWGRSVSVRVDLGGGCIVQERTECAHASISNVTS